MEGSWEGKDAQGHTHTHTASAASPPTSSPPHSRLCTHAQKCAPRTEKGAGCGAYAAIGEATHVRHSVHDGAAFRSCVCLSLTLSAREQGSGGGGQPHLRASPGLIRIHHPPAPSFASLGELARACALSITVRLLRARRPFLAFHTPPPSSNASCVPESRRPFRIQARARLTKHGGCCRGHG